jgi:putative ABC transport system permease protein
MRGSIVWRELLKESVVIGTAGVALGIPFGIGLGRLLLPVIARTAALQHDLVAPETAVVVEAASIAKAAGLGLVAAILAAAPPAWLRPRRSGARARSSRASQKVPAMSSPAC